MDIGGELTEKPEWQIALMTPPREALGIAWARLAEGNYDLAHHYFKSAMADDVSFDQIVARAELLLTEGTALRELAGVEAESLRKVRAQELLTLGIVMHSGTSRRHVEMVTVIYCAEAYRMMGNDSRAQDYYLSALHEYSVHDRNKGINPSIVPYNSTELAAKERVMQVAWKFGLQMEAVVHAELAAANGSAGNSSARLGSTNSDV